MAEPVGEAGVGEAPDYDKLQPKKKADVSVSYSSEDERTLLLESKEDKKHYSSANVSYQEYIDLNRVTQKP